MKLAVLSNINLDPLKLQLHRQMGAVDPYFCAYGQHLLELLNKQSGLYQRDLDAVFVHLDAEELLKDDFFRLASNPGENPDLADFLAALRGFCEERPTVNVIISSLALPPFSFASHLAGPLAPSAIEAGMNEMLRAFARNVSNVFLWDFQRLLRLHGRAFFYDDKYWYLGRIKYTQNGFKAMAEDLDGLLRAVRGISRKVLVLDLDNTLWGGVLGEDGPEGVKLSEDGIGKAYRDFQKCVKALKAIGVLLALNSKNDEDAVREFLEKSPMMVLKSTDFAAQRVNWKNKADNLREIAKELNVGLDSLVFVDDSPAERALVRQCVGEVAVPDFPADAALLKSWFLGEVVYRYFPRVKLTEADLNKTGQYERNQKRREWGSRLKLEDFIASLEIRLVLRKNDPQTAARIAQLTQKTNQFNLNNRRCTEAEVTHYMAGETGAVYGVEYEDKFGHEGLIGVCMVRREGECGRIDNFLLSCRVLGRGVENGFLSLVLLDLQTAGLTRVSAQYIVSSKNSVARNFYSNCGMRALGEGSFEMEIEPLIQNLRATHADIYEPTER